MTRGRREDFDEFVIEVWNLQSQPVRLVLECWQQGPKFRTSILLEPGRTIQRIPAASMNIHLYGAFGMCACIPITTPKLTWSFPGLILCATGDPADSMAVPGSWGGRTKARPASKVKCVIWDLDQTAWDGILGETRCGHSYLRPEVFRNNDGVGRAGHSSEHRQQERSRQCLARVGATWRGASVPVPTNQLGTKERQHPANCDVVEYWSG